MLQHNYTRIRKIIKIRWKRQWNYRLHCTSNLRVLSARFGQVAHQTNTQQKSTHCCVVQNFALQSSSHINQMQKKSYHFLYVYMISIHHILIAIGCFKFQWRHLFWCIPFLLKPTGHAFRKYVQHIRARPSQLETSVLYQEMHAARMSREDMYVGAEERLLEISSSRAKHVAWKCGAQWNVLTIQIYAMRPWVCTVLAGNVRMQIHKLHK